VPASSSINTPNPHHTDVVPVWLYTWVYACNLYHLYHHEGAKDLLTNHMKSTLYPNGFVKHGDVSKDHKEQQERKETQKKDRNACYNSRYSDNHDNFGGIVKSMDSLLMYPRLWDDVPQESLEAQESRLRGEHDQQVRTKIEEWQQSLAEC
jgi:saccharopine dehydrogenase-like NADP-dependent oxidoreductase